MQWRFQRDHSGTRFEVTGFPILLFLAATLSSLAFGGQRGERDVPAILDLGSTKIEIVSVTYVSEYEFTQGSWKSPENYRGAVVTLRITKPNGLQLKLYAADLCLHYYYGEEPDVSACRGLSSFSKALDEDRPMTFIESSIGKSTTGLATTAAGTVYVDVFFQGMEKNTQAVHLLIAQPAGAVFETSGWQTE